MCVFNLCNIRYKCNYKTCWKSLKGECGYKEFALHVISDHGGLEMVLRAGGGGGGWLVSGNCSDLGVWGVGGCHN